MNLWLGVTGGFKTEDGVLDVAIRTVQTVLMSVPNFKLIYHTVVWAAIHSQPKEEGILFACVFNFNFFPPFFFILLIVMFFKLKLEMKLTFCFNLTLWVK